MPVTIPTIPMPAWAHQWLMILLAVAITVSTSVSVWGPGIGLSLHAIVLVGAVAGLAATIFRVIDAAGETIVKNATVAAVSGAIVVASTTSRNVVLTNATAPGTRVPSAPSMTKYSLPQNQTVIPPA